jgi:hypothetical protein
MSGFGAGWTFAVTFEGFLALTNGLRGRAPEARLTFGFAFDFFVDCAFDFFLARFMLRHREFGDRTKIAKARRER